MPNKLLIIFLLLLIVQGCTPDATETSDKQDEKDTVLSLEDSIAALKPPVYLCTSENFSDSLANAVSNLKQLELPTPYGESFYHLFPYDLEPYDLYERVNPYGDAAASRAYEKAIKVNELFWEKSWKIAETTCSYLIYDGKIDKEKGTGAFISYRKTGVPVDTFRFSRPSSYEYKVYPGDLTHIDSSGKIHIKYFTVFSEAEFSRYLGIRTFTLLNNGVIARYFDKPFMMFESNEDSLDHYEYEKGLVVNHVKHGKWVEVEVNYDLEYNKEVKYPSRKYRKAYVEATYEHGTPVGVWEYYSVKLDTANNHFGLGGGDYYAKEGHNKGDKLLMREYYKDGRLVRREKSYDPNTPDNNIVKVYPAKIYTPKQEHFKVGETYEVFYVNSRLWKTHDTAWTTYDAKYGVGHRVNKDNILADLKRGDKVTIIDNTFLHDDYTPPHMYNNNAYIKVSYKGDTGYIGAAQIIEQPLPKEAEMYKISLQDYLKKHPKVGKAEPGEGVEIFIFYNTHILEVFDLMSFLKNPLLQKHKNYYRNEFQLEYYTMTGYPSKPERNFIYNVKITQDKQAGDATYQESFQGKYWEMQKVQFTLKQHEKVSRVMFEQRGTNVIVTVVYR